MVSFRVELGPASHTVAIGDGLLDRLGELAAAAGLRGRCAVITDTNVARLLAGRAEHALRAAGLDPVMVEVEPGEPSKSLSALERVYDRLIEYGLDRGASIFALGGGVVGDLAGFAAATFLRGVALVQIPTTLLAQVDSALGGKTAVNHRLGKNLIGAIYQPRLIVADVGLLRTLPEREFREGIAEVIKYGAIMDAPFIGELERDLEPLLARRPDLLEAIVDRCLRHKAYVVEHDEREAELRTILNFGHTVGHALENSAGYGRYLHGEAIAIGMIAAARLSCALAGLKQEEEQRLRALIAAYGLPTEMPTGWCNDEFQQALGRDKKRAGDAIRFVLLSALGKTTNQMLTQSEVLPLLASR
ncbi:MAG TPA: 3-dehydroquinate synthase [Candidatus Binataceae bacterium]|nr:3-dehydroquinate synthase [Candidatus Binataceae bacterium]